MIKRLDLAKKFELIVKQEIINHNKSILETNKSIDELRKQILSVNERSVSGDKKLDSEICSYIMQSEKVFKEIENKVHEQSKKLNDFIIRAANTLESYDCTFEEIEESVVHKHQFVEEIEQLTNKLLDTQFQHAMYKRQVDSDLNKMQLEYHRLLKEHKIEIAERPKELQVLESKVIHKFEETHSDIKINREEMEILKKKNFILEKRIERLETHIQRLEGK